MDTEGEEEKLTMLALGFLAYVELGLGVAFGLDLAFREKIVVCSKPEWTRGTNFAIHLIFWPAAVTALVTLALAEKAGR